MAFKRPSVQFCPAPPDILKTPDHRKMVGGFWRVYLQLNSIIVRWLAGSEKIRILATLEIPPLNPRRNAGILHTTNDNLFRTIRKTNILRHGEFVSKIPFKILRAFFPTSAYDYGMSKDM